MDQRNFVEFANMMGSGPSPPNAKKPNPFRTSAASQHGAESPRSDYGAAPASGPPPTTFRSSGQQRRQDFYEHQLKGPSPELQHDRHSPATTNATPSSNYDEYAWQRAHTPLSNSSTPPIAFPRMPDFQDEKNQWDRSKNPVMGTMHGYSRSAIDVVGPLMPGSPPTPPYPSCEYPQYQQRSSQHRYGPASSSWEERSPQNWDQQWQPQQEQQQQHRVTLPEYTAYQRPLNRSHVPPHDWPQQNAVNYGQIPRDTWGRNAPPQNYPQHTNADDYAWVTGQAPSYVPDSRGTQMWQPASNPHWNPVEIGGLNIQEEKSLRSLILDGLPELNILILGETGVGKSTFINAFVNYLTFDSIDEALKTRQVACVIKSAFTWQSVVSNEFVQHEIEVLPNTGNHNDAEALKDEVSSVAGDSNTQRPKTYHMQIGNTKVNLIDTPGIGDTRGQQQDKENMDAILREIRKVKELHGILILLKPNNARLGIMFKFCLKELLIHLHRDAAKNIVFGFTNARNTNFKPGDTYNILKKMLEDDSGIGIKMGWNITYCFDSESFRCLAAAQKGVDINEMGDIQDYRSSWNKSADETYRLLEHFRSDTTSPHRVEDTWGLRNTRELVRILTKPMADITQTINSNIALLQDEKSAVQDAIDRGVKLKGTSKITKVGYAIKELSMPRTVCSDTACTEMRDFKKHYTTICHNRCYLEGIEVDRIEFPQLMNCFAFHGNARQECNECGHRWQAHLHIMWEAEETQELVDDENVKQRIRENANDVEVARAAIKSREDRIRQYKRERDIIQKAAGQFSVYLKRSSIKPYNDSKLEYLEHLIQEEKSKVLAGGPRQRLDDLIIDRTQHEEEIRTLTSHIEAGKNDKVLDQAGIQQLIQELYQLKLSGADLKQVAGQMADIENSVNEKARAASGKPSISSRRSVHHGSSQRHGGETTLAALMAERKKGSSRSSQQPQQSPTSGGSGILSAVKNALF